MGVDIASIPFSNQLERGAYFYSVYMFPRLRSQAIKNIKEFPNLVVYKITCCRTGYIALPSANEETLQYTKVL